MVLEIEVVKTNGHFLGKLSLSDSATIDNLKKRIQKNYYISVERQSIRSSPRGKDETNSTRISNIKLEHNKIYVKDLGPQIGWDTVFYLEYSGPIVLYGLLFLFPQCVYSRTYWSGIWDGKLRYPYCLLPVFIMNRVCGGNPFLIVLPTSTYCAVILWTIHYAKRLWETKYVHRFSHGTMPLSNLFKNCGYYWGFALYIAYHNNHPLHTPPPPVVFYLGCLIFIVCEIGNLSIHLLLRDLRPDGSTDRKIPLPNSNPLTKLYNYVSCPNYTYEFGSWIGFTLITGSLPVFIFALAGLYQMSVWAIGKHKKCFQEFPNYPKQRKAILPFIL